MLTRKREPELMDDPQLDRYEHQKALKGLSRLNAVSGAANAIWRPIRRLYQERFNESCRAGNFSQGPDPIRILDIACGSGDVPLKLWQIACQAGIEVEVDGCDISEVAIQSAVERAKLLRAKSHFFRLDALNDPLPQGYDVITTSLFTHHLEERENVSLMKRMAESAKQLVVISDLVRSEVSLVLVGLACHTLSSSKVVHFDGPASVRAAFTPKELGELARQSGMSNAVITQRFPCRMVLSWRKLPD